MKKRVLFVTEAGHALSGYGKYYRELISRLYVTGKYELAELACCAEVSGKEAKQAGYVRWLYYPNAVNEKDPRFKNFMSSPLNAKGFWRFDRVCLDFKPDVVVDIRDPWDFTYQLSSPLRPYFHLCWMPTVDSGPQKEVWLDNFSRADSILTYSDYGLEVLRKEGFGKINLIASAPSGVDLKTFRPMPEKAALRKHLGIEEDALILGTVMRNQKRKLYPELIKAFKAFLERCKEGENLSLAARSYLYLHVSYPDQGWDIPGLVKNSGIAHKILFTYFCREANNWFVSRWADMKQISPFTGRPTAFLPNVTRGPNEGQLAQIYNLFDAYVQYAICEGFGMPQAEAAACGVPVFAVDYSAMSDVVRKVNGFPVKVQKMFRECETNADRAYPDNQDMADQLYTFFSLLSSDRKVFSERAREGCEQHYDWDLTSLTWQSHLDSIELVGKQGKWDSPPDLHESKFAMRDWKSLDGSFDVQGFLGELYTNTIGRPDLIGSYEYMTLVRDLSNGITTEGRGRLIDPNEVVEGFKRRAMIKNEVEECRCGISRAADEDYVEFAHTMAGGT